jgi:hypothetical protein
VKPAAARKFKIAGRPWRWIYRRMRSNYGLCDYGTRTITIDSTRTHSGLPLLDTTIHETLHALQAFATEEHTAETATTIAAILWELGYRLTDRHDGRGYMGE